MRPSNLLQEKWERIFSLRDLFLEAFNVMGVDDDYAYERFEEINDMLLDAVIDFCEWCMCRCTIPIVLERLIADPSEETARDVLRPSQSAMGLVTSSRTSVTLERLLEVREAVLLCIMREAVSFP